MGDFDAGAFRDLYCDLMEEIKQREAVVTDVVNHKTGLPHRVAYELCMLQLRLICELIALGCLAAHGDLEEVRAKKLMKEYNADQIMKSLTDLHPDFYPQPSRQIVDKKTKKVVTTERIKEGFLTRDDLRKLYGECGDVLHRGSLRQVLTEKKWGANILSVTAWIEKIRVLLNHHQIQLIDRDQQFWVLMQSNKDGRVHGALMTKIAEENKGGAGP